MLEKKQGTVSIMLFTIASYLVTFFVIVVVPIDFFPQRCVASEKNRTHDSRGGPAAVRNARFPSFFVFNYPNATSIVIMTTNPIMHPHVECVVVSPLLLFFFDATTSGMRSSTTT